MVHIRDKYQRVLDEWLIKPGVKEETKSIIRRGMWCCINTPELKDGILIVGMNPSFDKYHIEEPDDCTFSDVVNSNGSNYWKSKKKMVQGLNVPTAYLDLFPLRMTKQDGFMRDDVISVALKADLLRITQQQIESISPKIIINPNMGSKVYWGLNDKFSWMGYDMEIIDNPIDKGYLYKIKGIKSKSDVLMPNLETCLKHSYFLQYKYHGNGVLSKEQYLTSEDIRKLWNQITK